MQSIETTINGNEMKAEKAAVTHTDNTAADKLQYAKCPCCHANTLLKPIKIDGAVLDEFIACTMTGEPFKHAYKLYGGRISVVLQTAEHDAAALIIQTINALNRYTRNIFKDNTDDDILLQGIKNIIRIYSLITEITMNKGGELKRVSPTEYMQEQCRLLLAEFDTAAPATEADRETVTKRFAEIDKALNDPKHVFSIPANILDEMLQTHNNLYRLLLDAGFDENFWEGIELA